MINKEEIKKFLEENELTDIEVLQENDNMVMMRMFYNFDSDEIAAAENYEASLEDEIEEDDYDDEASEKETSVLLEEEINEDLEYENEDEDDYEEDDMYQYLSDIAIDHTGEVLEDLKDEFDVDVQYVGYDLDEDTLERYEFIALFFDESQNYDIEEELEKIGL